MVYIDISVVSVEDSVSFYVDKLGMFNLKAGRLICKFDIDLIIDMRQVGSTSHKDIFETDEHVISSFWIHVESSKKQPEYP